MQSPFCISTYPDGAETTVPGDTLHGVAERTHYKQPSLRSLCPKVSVLTRKNATIVPEARQQTGPGDGLKALVIG